MAISIVQRAQSLDQSVGGTGTFTAAFGVGVTTGNMMLAMFAYSNNGTITPPTGWTADDTSTNASFSIRTYHRVVQAGDGTSYSWTDGTAAHGALLLWEVQSGGVQTLVFDGHNAAISATLNVDTSITTTRASDFIVAACIAQDQGGSASGQPTFTAGGSYTTDQNTHGVPGNTHVGVGFLAEHQTQGAAGSISTGITVTSNVNGLSWNAFNIVALNLPVTTHLQHWQGTA